MAGWILKKQQRKKTLTGGTTYDAVNDTSIPAYRNLYFLNQTGGPLKVKVNDATDDDAETIVNNAPYNSQDAPQETPWKDTVTVNGTGSIIVEISYWKYE